MYQVEVVELVKHQILTTNLQGNVCVTVKGMSTQKSSFNIFDIRKRTPESDTDLGDDTQVKKRKFFP